MDSTDVMGPQNLMSSGPFVGSFGARQAPNGAAGLI